MLAKQTCNSTTQRSWGIASDLGFPVNEYNRLNFGVGYTSTGITQLNPYEQIRTFYEKI